MNTINSGFISFNCGFISFNCGFYSLHMDVARVRFDLPLTAGGSVSFCQWCKLRYESSTLIPTL